MSKVANLEKKLRLQTKKPNFDEMDPISILTFFKDSCDVCYKFGARIEVALLWDSYVIKKLASSSLKARLSHKKICAIGLHDERLSSCAKAVKYVLTIVMCRAFML